MKKPSSTKLDKLNNAKKNRVTIVDGEDYFRKDYKSLDTSGLSPNQRSILVYIYDTIKRSWSNGKGKGGYYDPKFHAYYAAIKRKNLADIFNLSEDIISQILGELEFIGYIRRDYIRKPGNKTILHIFVRQFYLSENNNQNVQKNGNNRESDDTKLDSNDENNDNSEQNSSNVKNHENDNKLNTHQQEAIDDAMDKMPNKEDISDESKSQVLDHGVIGSGSLPEQASNQIHKVANLLYKKNNHIPNHSKYKTKYKFIRSINGKIFGAKKSVAEQTGLWHYLRWENNSKLCDVFSDEIFSVLYTSYTKEDVEIPDNYFFWSVHDIFKDLTDEKLGKKPKNRNKRKKIKEKIPDWAKKDYEPNYKPIDNERKKELQEKLKKIN